MLMSHDTNPSTQASSRRIYSDTEFLAEHLSYLPVSVMDQLYNGYNLICYKAIDGLEEYIRNIPNLTAFDVHEALDRFQRRVEKELDKHFNTLQKYFYDNILHLPRDASIQLPHYKGLDLTATDEQEDLLDQELQKARRSVISQKAFGHTLETRIRTLDHDLETLERSKALVQSWHAIAHSEQASTLQDSARYVAEQAERLRQRVATTVQAVKHDAALDRAAKPDELTRHLVRTVQKHLDMQQQGR